MPSAHPRLSIIIVTYNAGDKLLEVLDHIPAGTGALSTETIVSDNQSADGMPQQIREHYPHIRVIENAANRGFAAGNNRGLEAAQGDYLLLLNPDVVVEPNSLAMLVDYLETHTHVGIAAPRTFDAQGDIALSGFGKYTALSVLWQFLGFDRFIKGIFWSKYRQPLLTATEPFNVEWVQASCMMFRRAVYDRIGGMDEGLFLFAEDPDYCDRTIQAGWQVMVLPAARVHHEESTTISRYPYLKMLHYHISPLHYFRKRGKNGSVLLLKIGFILELGIKFGLRSIQYTVRRRKDINAKRVAYTSVIREVWRY